MPGSEVSLGGRGGKGANPRLKSHTTVVMGDYHTAMDVDLCLEGVYRQAHNAGKAEKEGALQSKISRCLCICMQY